MWRVAYCMLRDLMMSLQETSIPKKWHAEHYV